MVVLRDGKSYNSADAVTPERPVRLRATRRSTRLSQASELHTEEQLYTESEPSTPQTVPKKRVRESGVRQLEPILDTTGDTIKEDQELQLAAETELPSLKSTPSPTHKKARPASHSAPKPAKQSSVNNGLMVAVLVLLLAVAGAAVWSQHGVAIKQSAQQALQAVNTHIRDVQLADQFAAAQASAAATGASALALLHSKVAYAQQHLHTVLLQLHVKYPTLVTKELVGGLKRFRLHPVEDHHAWAQEVLAAIVPEEQHWQEIAADISDTLRTPAAARSYKATAFILACGSKDDCAEAAAALSVLPPRGDACSLVLDSSKLSDGIDAPAAALQAKLAPFLRRCPDGLIILQAAEQLPAAAAPALVNALSELGGFQHDGKVDGSHAAYALLLQLPAQQVAAAAASADTAAAVSNIKEAFFSLLQLQLSQHQQAAVTSEDALDRAVKALHRRIDFAAPVKLGTAAEAEADLAVQTSEMEMPSAIVAPAGADILLATEAAAVEASVPVAFVAAADGAAEPVTNASFVES